MMQLQKRTEIIIFFVHYIHLLKTNPHARVRSLWMYVCSMYLYYLFYLQLKMSYFSFKMSCFSFKMSCLKWTHFQQNAKKRELITTKKRTNRFSRNALACLSVKFSLSRKWLTCIFYHKSFGSSINFYQFDIVFTLCT